MKQHQNFDIPQKYLELYEAILKKGYEAYFVGGSVRNLLMGLPVKDWDIATNAKPEEIQKIFSNSFYDNTFGTVGIPLVDKEVVEITTYRSESEYADRRHPEKIEWGKTIEEDLKRRDFTMNAIAYSPKDQLFIDPFDGKKDIEKKLIKCVGNPSERFSEDALRLLRAVRFSSELGFEIDKDTLGAIKNNSQHLKQVSSERIRIELLKTLACQRAWEGTICLIETGLMLYIIPELLEGLNVSQERPGRHHTEDVLTHNLLSLKFCPSTDPLVKFSTLIHDIGKPRVESQDENNLVIFYNHEIEGAKMAWDICDRLKFSRKEREKVVTLVRWHMFSVDEHITDAAIRRFIRRVGYENVKDIIDLRIGDRLGSGTKEAESWRLKKFKERIESELGPKPFSMEDMTIDGNDVMNELNLKPGPKVGTILEQLFNEVDEDLSKNKRDYLLNRIREINNEQG